MTNLSGEQTQFALDDLLFHVRRSRRYHDSRRGFLEGFQNFKNLASVILGSAAVVKLFTTAGGLFLTIAALIVGILSAIDLVYKSSTKARDHSDLRRRFIELEEEILGVHDPTREQIHAWEQKRLVIEASEPPILKVLDAICHNQQLLADGYERAYFLKIGKVQRFFAQVITLGADSINQEVHPRQIFGNSKATQVATVDAPLDIKEVRQ
jgi:hypothetical protein